MWLTIILIIFQCPVFDLDRNVEFTGVYQTMTRNAGLTVRVGLTLPMLTLYIRPMHKNAKIFENHLNPVMLVFIWKLSLSTLRWVPICQGFGDFSGFLHHFVLMELVTSSTRVNYCCITTPLWVWIQLVSCEKVTSDLGLCAGWCSVFCWALRFPPSLITG